MVYLGRGLARDLIATIPSDLKYHARDPKRNVALGGRNAIFVPMTGAPYVRDLENVSRNPLLDDLAMFHKLNPMLPSLHSSAHHMAEPNDHPKCALILDWAPHAISAAVIHVNVPQAMPNLFQRKPRTGSFQRVSDRDSVAAKAKDAQPKCAPPSILQA